MGVFFMLTIAAVDALDHVPVRYINRALTKGANGRQILRYVKLPFILPQVFTILRLNFIAAWMAVLAAEMTGLNDGLGGIFMTGRNLFNNNLIMMGMFLIAVTGFVVDIILNGIQQCFFRWRAGQ
jgi:NitT/TauT family transport system permease protein